MSAHRDLTRGDDQLRIASWRGDDTTAYLTPARGRVTSTGVERSLEQLTRTAYREALTSALAPAEQAPFLTAGFAVHERLHLLIRSLEELPDVGHTVALRRRRHSDRDDLLAVDHAAFPPFWRLDGAGLDDAVGATPSARLRLAVRPGGEPGVAGYAVTGRAGPRGYLQRLAVDPELQRRGIGTALVVDGLRWLRRWGAREVLVNTQEENHVALALYEALGFRRQAEGLAVLRRTVDGIDR